MPSTTDFTGVLLVNLGTPDSPSPSDVRRYLREFLSDPRVLTMPALARWLLLNLVILPTRPRRSAEAYEKIWLPEGSPLLIHSRDLREAVARELGDGFQVELGMRYGEPSIEAALERLQGSGAKRLVILPLFPQYSEAATGSALARTRECLAALPGWAAAASPRVIESFHDEPRFISALAGRAEPMLSEFRPDHVLLSYHGLPESQLRHPFGQAKGPASETDCLTSADCCADPAAAARGCYRAQCFATSRALAESLDLDADRCTTSFQSRLGRTPWIRPYTDEIITTLAERGVKRLAVLCPAFAADCLETLEEIGIRLRVRWLEIGGDELLLCPCPNAEPGWARSLAEMIREQALD